MSNDFSVSVKLRREMKEGKEKREGETRQVGLLNLQPTSFRSFRGDKERRVGKKERVGKEYWTSYPHCC